LLFCACCLFVAPRSFMIHGGGAPEVELSMQLGRWADELEGMESFCIKAFADALEVIPRTLAENAGLHPVTITTQLRKMHNDGKTTAGINVKKGIVAELKGDVVQPLLVNLSAISLASEVTRMILKIDDMVTVMR
jgi:T-complex protein 1 subunit delta